MIASNSRRRDTPGRPPEVRKARALRPMLDACEPRIMLSGATTRVAIEALQFSATTVSRSGVAVELAGTLHLTEGPRGDLAGTLVEAGGKSLKVRGTLKGEQVDLGIRLATGKTLRADGPVVSATTADGQLTLHGGGLLPTGGGHSQGTFTIQGSDVVLPAETLPNPAKVARVIPAGTTLMPTNFVGRVTAGPDAGTILSGVLSLGKVGKDGSFAGSLADPVNGTIPVTGQVAGRKIELKIDAGLGDTFGGVGPFDATKVGKGQVALTSFGSLQTGNPADSGDWSLTRSPLSYQNLSSQRSYNLTLNNASLVGTNFTSTQFDTINITNSSLQSVNFSNAHVFDIGQILENSTFQGVNFSQATLRGDNLSGSDFSGSNLFYTNLAGANLTGTKLPTSLYGTAFDKDNLAGRQLANDDLTYASLVDVNLAGANLTGAKLAAATFTGANLRGAVITGATGMSAHTQLVYKLQNQGGAGLDLSGQDLSKEDLSNVNLSGATLTGANLTNTNLTGANLTNATYTVATLSQANLTNANLSGANLAGFNLVQAQVNLTGANLTDANLSGALIGVNTMVGANLTNANFGSTILFSVDLAGANLTNAHFTAGSRNHIEGANLRGAVITGATGLTSLDTTVYKLQNSGGVGLNLTGRDFFEQDLGNVDLTNANLQGDNLYAAYLGGATLTGTNFVGANLTDVFLTDHYVTAADLTADHAKFDPTTIFSGKMQY